MFLISTRNYPPELGGIQNLMEGLSKSLLNHGPVKVFADTHSECESYDNNSKINIERVSGLKIFRKYRKANLVNDFLNNNNVRAVFFDHWKSLEHIKKSNLDKTVSFCLIHSKEINHNPGSFLSKRMLKSFEKVKYVIANSNFTKNLAIEKGIEERKIKVINPGCNYPLDIEKKIDDNAKDIFKDSFPKLITVSRLDKRKGHQNILMCIKNLKPKFPKIKYVSIGDGEEKNNLEKLKKELKLGDEVTFLFKTNEQMKVALIKNSDLFLMPSTVHKKSIEGFGIVFIEAACYGKASIGGNSGGEKDAILDGKTGFICDGNDLNSIYEKVIKIFDNQNYKVFGDNALQYSKNFRWNTIIKKYLELM